MKRKLLIFLGALFILSLPVAIATGAFFWRFKAKIPTADYPEPASSVEARLQDIDYLAKLPDVDQSFSGDERKMFTTHIERLKDTAADMSQAQFNLAVAKAAAISENGHTNLHRVDLLDGLTSLPIRFFWFGDGLYIVRTRDTYAHLLGAKVLAYEGEEPGALITRLDPYFGGNEAFLRFNSPTFLSSPEIMQSVGLAKSADSATLILQLPDLSEDTLILPVEADSTPPISPDDAPLSRTLTRETDSGNSWAFLPAETFTIAHYGRLPETIHWTDNLPGNGFYIRLRLILDQDDISLSKWFTALAEELKAKPVNYLVIDVRSTFGGDYTKARAFARGVKDYVIPDGNIYLLTDGGTFSAAIVAHAFALEAGGDQAIVVGTEIGDDAQFWAEGGAMLKLPNSGHRIWVTTGYHDWESGCNDWSKCFWLNIVMGVAAGPLGPDIIAPMTFADYSKGIDTTMLAVYKAEDITP
ncbi:MAG: hypothetical protein AAF950_11165 [Pseudomonadota bacterium]